MRTSANTSTAAITAMNAIKCRPVSVRRHVPPGVVWYSTTHANMISVDRISSPLPTSRTMPPAPFLIPPQRLIHQTGEVVSAGVFPQPAAQFDNFRCAAFHLRQLFLGDLTGPFRTAVGLAPLPQPPQPDPHHWPASRSIRRRSSSIRP